MLSAIQTSSASFNSDKLYICEHCGLPADDPRHVCKPMTVELKYACESCGRLSTSRSLLCKPKALKG